MPDPDQWVIADNRAASQLVGRNDAHLKQIERALSVRLTARGNVVGIQGEEASAKSARRVLDLLAEWAENGVEIRRETVDQALSAVEQGHEEEFRSLLADGVLTTFRGRTVRPETVGQARYLRAMRQNPLVFGIGPAGTGKTFLAMAIAVAALKAKDVDRLVLTRPAVEAGEKLGFLPGDLQDKVDPYLRPLYDALFEMLGLEAVDRYRDRGIIEVAPLAYMRGRTLSNSFVILDEAQNTTHEQMKMFLTRLGRGTRVVVTGDITQVDLPVGVNSGLRRAADILEGLPEIEVVRLGQRDVVRHPLVQTIVAAYEAAEEKAAAHDA
ncbi:MAG: PhoH family protein [Clostridia bacterium]